MAPEPLLHSRTSTPRLKSRLSLVPQPREPFPCVLFSFFFPSFPPSSPPFFLVTRGRSISFAPDGVTARSRVLEIPFPLSIRPFFCAFFRSSPRSGTSCSSQPTASLSGLLVAICFCFTLRSVAFCRFLTSPHRPVFLAARPFSTYFHVSCADVRFSPRVFRARAPAHFRAASSHSYTLRSSAHAHPQGSPPSPLLPPSLPPPFSTRLVLRPPAAPPRYGFVATLSSVLTPIRCLIAPRVVDPSPFFFF